MRQRFIYSEKRARDLILEAVETLLDRANQSGNSPILSRLTREAAQYARQRAQCLGYDFANWETATKAVINAMLSAGVLLGSQGSSVAPGVAAQATEITGLKESFRDLLEGYLLEVLIRSLGDVSIRDHTALAHALFRQFDPNVPMEDLEDRVAVLLARLDGRVVLHPNGTYCFRDEAAQASLF